jgi:hypothetical protein
MRPGVFLLEAAQQLQLGVEAPVGVAYRGPADLVVRGVHGTPDRRDTETGRLGRAPSRIQVVDAIVIDVDRASDGAYRRRGNGRCRDE